MSVETKAVCVDDEAADLLEKGKTYYLFANGSEYAYVSRFPNQNAHFGCFSKDRFQIIKEQEEEWPPEPGKCMPVLENGAIYTASLIWREPRYKGVALGEYYLKAGKTHAYFYEDPYFKKFRGCFPLYWFRDFQAVEVIEKVREVEKLDIPEQEFEEIVHFSYEEEITPEKIEQFEQLSLF